MIWSGHALRRFKERFPELDNLEEYAKACRNRIGARTLKRIRKQCPLHAEVTSHNFRGFYYKVSPQNKVVFVITPPETIITVFKLEALL